MTDMLAPAWRALALGGACLICGTTLAALLPQDPVAEPRFKGELLAAWLPRLVDLDPDTQAAAAFAVGRFGPDAIAAVPSLLRLLGSDEITRDFQPARAIAAEAAEALGRIGSATPDVVTTLAGRAQREIGVTRVSHEIARAALRGIAALGPGGAPSTEILTKILLRQMPRHPTPFQDVAPLQREAARALGKIGPAAAAALPSLERVAATSGDVLLAMTAREAVGLIKSAPPPPTQTDEDR
ncbi:MAG: HEAT repeat domain-containing protein [Planctomycetota bacterium]